MANSLTYDQVVALADEITTYAAFRIAQEIDAGSERDAVIEDLTQLMRHYVAGWSNEPDLVGQLPQSSVDTAIHDATNDPLRDTTKEEPPAQFVEPPAVWFRHLFSL